MYRRLFAMILAFVMVFSMLPGAAMATDEAPATEPVVTEPQTTEPKTTEPKATEPKATEPKATEPKATEPKATEPKATEPKATEPAATEPKATEPQATEPAATEPQATQPAATEPAPPQKIKFTNPGKRNTETTSITAKFSFEFPEDSGLTEADIGSADVILTAFNSDGDPYTDDRMKISADNGWTAYFELEPGDDYSIRVENAGVDGYSYSVFGDTYVNLEAGENEARTYTIVYEVYEDDSDNDYIDPDDPDGPGWVTISLNFAADSALKDEDIGDVTVAISADTDWDEDYHSAVLSSANGRTEKLPFYSLRSYTVYFSGLAQDGYTYSLEGDTEFDPYDDDRVMTFTIKYAEGNPQFTLSLDFAEDSALKDSDIGNIVARFYDDDGLAGQLALTRENGRTASVSLEPGWYSVSFGGWRQEGYAVYWLGSEWEWEWDNIYIGAGEGVTQSFTLRYVENEVNKAKLRVSLNFAEDSALQDADIGDITVVAYEDLDFFEMGRATLTSDGGRTAELALPSDWYNIELKDHEKDGYYCDISSDVDLWGIELDGGDTLEINITLRYTEDKAKLKLSLAFAEDSAYQDADIGDITAQIYKEYGDDVPVGSLVLTQENNRTAEITLSSGWYELVFSGNEKEGYLVEYNGSEWIYVDLTAGEETFKTLELKYIKDGGKVTIDLDLDDDSVLDETAIGTITAGFYPYYGFEPADEPAKTVELTQDSGWTATVDLPSGEYDIRFSGYEVEGYWCSLEDEYGYIEVVNGDELREAYSFFYVEDACELTVSLDFISDSVIKGSEVGAITAEIYRYDWSDTEDEVEAKILVDTLTLTEENGRTGKVTLPAGYYYIYFSGYEKAGYYCTLEDRKGIDLDAGYDRYLNAKVAYVDNESTISISLDFAEDSALGTNDFGDITAQIYRTRWEEWSDEPAELVGSVALTKENGRKGELTVKLDGYFETDYDSMDYGWINDYRYELQLAGMDQDGYRYVLENADNQIDPMPGDKVGWNVTAKYAQAEHNVTVKVRLSDDSNVSPTKLKGKVSLNLEDTVDKMVNESVDHTGSKVFTHTFKNLPDSDRYHLDLDVGIGFLQSITCTGGELKKDLKKGQLEFSLNGDCEIEVVLELKKTADDEATLILRFTEDSALQAEDFPQGITLAAHHEYRYTYYAVDRTITFYPENDWTKVVKVIEDWSFKISEHPEGYIGTVRGSVSIDDCPTTVYLDVCFEEYEPYYLDVELFFDENSDLTSDEVGSIFLDVNDCGTTGSYEFKEGSWHQTIELHGDINSIIEEYEHFSLALRDLARAGYSYTVEPAYEEDEYGNAKENYVSDHFAISNWERGKKVCYAVTICYTETPGELVVDVVSSPYGGTCDTIITVTDENGNEVAQAVCDYDNDYQCTIDLPAAGTYTVTPTAKDPSEYMEYSIDEPVTIQFNPADGAAVTLLCEERSTTTLEIFKFFGEDSCLGPEDFPEGITVILTDVTGHFTRKVKLSDANGWSTSVSLPDGSYTATEEDADKEGYIRTTRFVFARSGDYTVGGESLRPWDLRNRAQEPKESRASVTDGPVGGPYYIHGNFETYNNLTIHNTYVPDPNAKTTGSITITAGDGFYDFESNEELDEKPDTGSEAESYTYIVSTDGEEQTVTLKPGETFTLDGLEEGTAYSITPGLPAGYPWNADVTPITGTVGGEDEDDWNVEVSFENDYYYTYEDGTLTVVKTDALTDETLKGAKFGLYADKDCTDLIAKATTDKDGICSFTLTEEGTYYLKELKAPEDYYEKSEEVKTVTVETKWVLETREGTKVLVQKLSASVAGLPQKDGGYVWENERKTTDISVTKRFAYDEDLERPEYVIAVLYRDGEAYDWAKLSADNNWNYVWKDMPLGFEYTVDEADVPEGYYKQVRSDGYDFTIINSGSIIPQTGDDNMIVFWSAMAMVSLCAIAFLTEQKRRQRV